MMDSANHDGRASGLLVGLVAPIPLATYDTMGDAAKAVDLLVEQDIKRADLVIVGTDLRSVERAARPTAWRDVLLAGALTGVLWGLLLAVLFWLLVPGHTVYAIIGWGLLFGVVYGCVSQVVQTALAPHPSPETAVVALHYELLGEAAIANQARALLAVRPSAWRPQTGNTGIIPVVHDAAPDQSEARARVFRPPPPVPNPAAATSQAANRLADLMTRLSTWSSQPVDSGGTAQEATAAETTGSLPRVRDAIPEDEAAPTVARRFLG